MLLLYNKEVQKTYTTKIWFCWQNTQWYLIFVMHFFALPLIQRKHDLIVYFVNSHVSLKKAVSEEKKYLKHTYVC